MPAPSVYPDWDTNLTHTTPTLSAHKTDGYASNEVPGSDEINYQLNLQGQWLRYLDQQRLALRLDQLLPATDNTVDADVYEAPTDYIYAIALRAGAAFPKQGSANNKVKIAAGTLLQLTGGALYAYEFDGTLEVSIANGDPSNPRVDIIQMQLSTAAVTQTPTATVSVKQGTPAASPTYPAPDAGYCVIAAVVVGATYSGASALILGEDTAGAVAVVHDQRMPLGVKSTNVIPNQAVLTTADWTLVNGNALLQKANNTAGSKMYFTLQNHGYVGRLLDVAQGFLDKNTQDSRISRFKYADGGGGTVAVSFIDMAHANINGSGSNSYKRRRCGELTFQTSTLPMFNAGPTVQANANGMGPPIWTNGRRCFTEPYTDGSDTNTSLPLSQSILVLCWVATGTSDSGTLWGPATFWVAGGL